MLSYASSIFAEPTAFRDWPFAAGPAARASDLMDELLASEGLKGIEGWERALRWSLSDWQTLGEAYLGWSGTEAHDRPRSTRGTRPSNFRRASGGTPLTDWLRRVPRVAMPRAALPALLVTNHQPRGLVLAA